MPRRPSSPIFAMHGVGDPAFLVPPRGVRRELGLREVARHVADHPLLFGEEVGVGA